MKFAPLAFVAAVCCFAGTTSVQAYDDDAPAVRAAAKALSGPVRVNVVHVTRLDARHTNALQLPVMRVAPNRTATIQVGNRRYQVSATAAGRKDSMAITLNYAVQRENGDFRTLAEPTLILRSGNTGAISAGRDEFRITASYVNPADEELRYVRSR